jgi:ABC-type uncharacterized transport system permease subunit
MRLSGGILYLLHESLSIRLWENQIVRDIGLSVLWNGLIVSLGHFLIGREDWSHRAESNRGHPHYESIQGKKH